MSLLTVIQDAADRLSIVRPSSVIGTADQQVRQLLGLAQQEGKELARAHPWQRLTKEKTFTSIAAETQTSAIPSDFDRFVTETFYNRTSKRPVEGPFNPQEWQKYKAFGTGVASDAFRVRGNSILLAPAPSAGLIYAYEYVSKWWCTTSGGTEPTLAAWTGDDNDGILDEELMTLGVIWRFLKSKGLDYSETFRTYEIQVGKAAGHDGGKRTVSMAKSSGLRKPGVAVPDGSWSLS